MDILTDFRYRQFYRFFRADSRRILDVGCGVGRGGAMLHRLDGALELHGLDCVEDHQGRLSDRYALGIAARASAMPLADGVYDVVLAGEMIEHLHDAVVDRALTEFHRVLRAGGLLLLTTPNMSSLSHRFFRSHAWVEDHHSAHQPRDLARRLHKAGFSGPRWYGTGRASRLLGMRFPLLAAYGSFLMKAEKKA